MQIYHEKYDLHRFLPDKRFSQASRLRRELQLHRLRLAICISICNEPYSEFLVTLKSLLRNIYILTQNFADIDQNKIVIFLIQDGKENITHEFQSDATGKIINRSKLDKIKMSKDSDMSKPVFQMSNNPQYSSRERSQSDALKEQVIRAVSHEERTDSKPYLQRPSLPQLKRDNSKNKPPQEMHQLSRSAPKNKSNELTSSNEVVDLSKQVPMSEKGLKKWNQTMQVDCFLRRTSNNMFYSNKDRVQLLDFCYHKVPAVKFVYVIKEARKGKLDTHRHFFTGFCEDLKPKYCSLVDVGTTFDDHSYLGFLRISGNKTVGGVCQEIEVKWQLNLLALCQFMDYKLDQILKAAQGLYGLVQIMPGAHQFLRWDAVRGRVLQIYIEGTEHQNYKEGKDSLGLFKRNVFLTEDKLAGALILLTQDKFYTIQFLPGAKAYTDVPGQVASIQRQRRRWLNGGFSTNLYIFARYCKTYKTTQLRKEHSCLGFMLFLQLLYHLLQIFVQSSVALTIVTTHKFVYKIETAAIDHHSYPEDVGVFNMIFFVLLIALFIVSLFGNSRNRFIGITYKFISYGLMYINALKYVGLFYAIHQAFKGDSSQEDDLLIAIAFFSLYFVLFNFFILFLTRPRQFCCNLHKYLLSTTLYLLFQNTFFLMIKFYMVCNYHDVTWGARGKDQKKARNIICRYRKITVLLIALWLFYNGILILLIELLHDKEDFVILMGVFVFVWITIRGLEAVIYWLKYCKSIRHKLYRNLKRNRPLEEQEENHRRNQRHGRHARDQSGTISLDDVNVDQNNSGSFREIPGDFVKHHSMNQSIQGLFHRSPERFEKQAEEEQKEEDSPPHRPSIDKFPDPRKQEDLRSRSGRIVGARRFSEKPPPDKEERPRSEERSERSIENRSSRFSKSSSPQSRRKIDEISPVKRKTPEERKAESSSRNPMSLFDSIFGRKKKQIPQLQEDMHKQQEMKGLSSRRSQRHNRFGKYQNLSPEQSNRSKIQHNDDSFQVAGLVSEKSHRQVNVIAEKELSNPFSPERRR